MAEISLCMIVKNEEDVLARCLESVQGFADEIIIVDTGSSDATKEIARRYTPLVYDFVWIDDFAAARNESFCKATRDFIMWLDADDVLLEEDRASLIRLKQELDDSVDLVMARYNVAFDAQGNPTMSYFRERLMRRACGFRWIGAVHEVITPAGNIRYSEAAITHRKLHPTDPDRNLHIFESMIAKGEELDPRQQYYYARELFFHGRYEEAAEKLTAFLDGGRGWIENNIGACLDLSNCCKLGGKPEGILPALTRSFAYDLPRAEICCAVGAYFIERGEYRQAAYWYRTASRCKPNLKGGGFQSPDSYGYTPYLQLCVCYDRMGDHKTAERYHKKAKRLKPNDPAVLYNEQYFQSLRGGETS